MSIPNRRAAGSGRFTIFVLLAAGAVLLTIGAYGYVALGRSFDDLDQVNHSNEILATMQGLLSWIEKGRYDHARHSSKEVENDQAAVRSRVDSLLNMTADQPELKQILHELKALRKDSDHATDALISQPQRVNGLITLMSGIEHGILLRQADRARESKNLSLKLALGGTLSGLALLCIAVFLFLQQQRRLELARAAAAREREQLKKVITDAPVAIAMLDTELRYLSHSRRWIDDHEILYTNVIGKTQDEALPALPERWRALCQRALAGETLSSPEDAFPRPNGTRHWLRWAIHPWYEPEGPVGGIIAVTETIDELVEAREAALESARFKSAFLANMSHELRTPINGIVGMTNLLLGSSLDSEQRDYAETVKHSADTLLSLVNDILDFSKIDAGKAEIEEIDFDLRRLVREVEKIMSLAAGRRGIEFQTSVAPEIPPLLRGDPGKLLQLISNLVNNAIKFTPRGRVSLSLRLTGQNEHGVTIRAEVVDTGIGIPRDAQERLFKPFVQADASTTRRYGGTGLGLSICKQLTELMGGKIGVDSEDGMGSRFWFTLDLKPGQGALIEIDEALFPEPRAREGRVPHILVAEDNITNQKVAVLTLEKLGFRATAVANGQEAVDALREIPFDLVLMDCQMPEMDGYRATAVIRKSRTLPDPRLPIIAITANALPEDRTRCIEAGMNDYLPKPVRAADLVAMLDKWLPEQLPDRHLARKSVSKTSSPQNEPTELPVVDKTMVAELKALSTPGTNDAFDEIVRVYLKNSRERIERMKAALSCGEISGIVIEAHSMKSSSGNVGASRLAPICREIEERAKSGKLDGIAKKIELLEREFAEATFELERLLAEKPQAA